MTELPEKATPMPFVWTRWGSDKSVDLEERRIKKLFRGVKAPTLVTFARGRLTPSERRWLAAEGTTGVLVQAFRQFPWLLRGYPKSGWPAVLAAIVHYKEPASAVAEALWELSLFSEFGWRIKWCTYKDEIHWFVHQPTGRPPEACPLHRNAARLDRWRKSSITKGKATPRPGKYISLPKITKRQEVRKYE